MKIVKFKDGKYGVRKKSMGEYKFLDLESGRFWWSQDSEYFRCCKFDLETAKKFIEMKTDPGEPLEPSFFRKLINKLKSIEWEK